ncbi:MAG: hypothetical protein A7315_13810 [Candidatus Altiarchaeales archaeon WOR_SM1_79]|nr:MAG: hypothetical protein A7315_13810 [Candidatus Altiarchaeales archaeon WOR_SM1_79]
MKNFKEIKEILTEHKQELREKFKVKEIGIFGSYVKGEEKEKSDVDILIDIGGIGLLRFIELEYYLSDMIGVKVDLVMKTALKPRIGKQILMEVKYI